ncbi:hypothetical protein BGX27_002648, partial [Mortierella sp. AM989]
NLNTAEPPNGNGTDGNDTDGDDAYGADTAIADTGGNDEDGAVTCSDDETLDVSLRSLTGHVLDCHTFEGVITLGMCVVIIRAALLTKFGPKSLLPDAALKNKVLRILDYLCHVISNPPYKTSEPSETDSLLIWTHVFSLITEDIALLSGEKMLEASKILRREQSREFGGLTEAGRKVDLSLCYAGIELSNIEFKRAGITPRDINMQSRKNIRLGQCIQQSHQTIGLTDLSLLLADISGYVCVFYNIVEFEGVWAVGRATMDFAHLPTTEGALIGFMNDSSLAQIFAYFDILAEKGKKAKRAKERHDVQLAKQGVGQAVGSAQPIAPPPKSKTLTNNVIFTPTKKRT